MQFKFTIQNPQWSLKLETPMNSANFMRADEVSGVCSFVLYECTLHKFSWDDVMVESVWLLSRRNDKSLGCYNLHKEHLLCYLISLKNMLVYIFSFQNDKSRFDFINSVQFQISTHWQWNQDHLNKISATLQGWSNVHFIDWFPVN